MSMREAFHIDDDDLIQYALGTLSLGQLSQYTAHVSLCNECRDKLALIQVELASVGTVLPQNDLPVGARSRFMVRLEREVAAKGKAIQNRGNKGLYIAGRSAKSWMASPVPMMILSGALAAGLALAIFDDLSNIHKLRMLMPELSRFERQATELANLKDFLQGPNTQQVSLHERPTAVKAPEGHAIYSAASGRLVFTAANMPALPPGKVYELWLLPATGSAPLPAGLFKPDSQGSAAVIFPTLSAAVPAGGFGVTIEDAAGSPTPTSPIVLSGQ
jgi:anti-sigma-K factor RskA